MKLLLVAPRFPPDQWSGSTTVAAGLYAQARRHHEVRLVAGYVRDRTKVPAEAIPVALEGVKGPAAWGHMTAAILREVRGWKPDVVVSNGLGVPPLPVPTVGLVHRLGVVTGRGWLEQARIRSGRLQARALDRVIAASGAVARGLQQSGLSADRIRVVQPGVDTTRVFPEPEARADVGTEARPLRFIYPSRILPGKGQHHAIDAIARMHRSLKKRATLTIAGAAVDRVYLDQLRVQAWGQPVDFALDVADMPALLREHDAVLYPPELGEGFAFGAVEGMASGLPVIWADQPATREATGGLGLPVEKADVDAMRNAMVRLLDEPALRQELREAGLHMVQTHRTWERAWARYETEINAVAG